MIVKSLSLKNIRSYTDEKIVFPEGSTLLSGDIGSGKSTILLALDFVLFGIRRGEIEGSELLRNGKNTGSVEAEIELSGRKFTIKRSLKRSKTSIAQESGELVINGIVNELMPTELNAKIIEMLGYPKDMKKKIKPIFRYTVYTPQEEMKQILFNSELRLDMLRKIFNIDRYSIIKNNANILITELRALKRELAALSSDMEEMKKDVDAHDYERKRIRGEVSELKKSIEKLDEEMKIKKREIETLQENMIKSREKKELHQKIESTIKTKELRISKIKIQMDEYEKRISRLLMETENLRKIEKPEMTESEIKRKIDSSEEEKESSIKEISTFESEIHNFSSILNEGKCSVCKQKVSDPAHFIAYLDECKKRKNECEKNLEKTENTIKYMNSLLERHRNYSISYEKLASHEVMITDAKSSRNRLKEELESEKKELDDLTKEMNQLSFSTASIREIEKKYADAYSGYEMVENEKRSKEMLFSRLEQKNFDMEKLLEELISEIRKKEDSRKKSEKVSQIIFWLENYFYGLMDTIEKHVMFAIQCEFNEYFRKWFRTIIPDENMSVKISDNFVPIIEQNGYETDYMNLSGGEKTSIALAYRLALNKVINTMIENIRTKDIIILDEPTDGFSADQLDRIRDVLNELQLKQVIIVSHEPKIDTFVDNVIRIYKENHMSRIAG